MEEKNTAEAESNIKWLDLPKDVMCEALTFLPLTMLAPLRRISKGVSKLIEESNKKPRTREAVHVEGLHTRFSWDAVGERIMRVSNECKRIQSFVVPRCYSAYGWIDHPVSETEEFAEVEFTCEWNRERPAAAALVSSVLTIDKDSRRHVKALSLWNRYEDNLPFEVNFREYFPKLEKITMTNVENQCTESVLEEVCFAWSYVPMLLLNLQIRDWSEESTTILVSMPNLKTLELSLIYGVTSLPDPGFRDGLMLLSKVIGANIGSIGIFAVKYSGTSEHLRPYKTQWADLLEAVEGNLLKRHPHLKKKHVAPNLHFGFKLQQ